MPQTTNFRINGVEIGTALDFMDKEYVIENYPEINNVFKQAGLWLWGDNGSGQLGTNNTTSRSSPVQTVSGGSNWKEVSCGFGLGSAHTVAIKTDGTLWLWGDNANGQLGDNSRTARSSPVQTVSGGTNWKQVSCGGGYTGAIKTDESLWLWGSGGVGELGNNATTNRSSPVQTVSGGTDWKQVSCGRGHTGAIKTDGSLWLWGDNSNGQLGTNNITLRSSPVQTVSGGTNWRTVSCGIGYTAAIKTDGTLWLWGDNSNGELGDNSRTARSSPVQTVSGGTNWKTVSVGYSHTAAIKTDGTLWLWGSSSSGQLGNNATTNRSSPVQTVSGGTNWKQVFVGGVDLIDADITAAIKTDGSLWLWGSNSSGQLGDNTRTLRSSPVQTVAGGTNWKSVSYGYLSTAAIRDDSQDQL